MQMVFTLCDGDVGASPELLWVVSIFTAHQLYGLDPILLVGSTRAWPEWRIEVVVARVLASDTGVCKRIAQSRCIDGRSTRGEGGM